MNANLIAINPLPSVSGTQRPNQSFTGIRNLPAGELAGEMGKRVLETNSRRAKIRLDLSEHLEFSLTKVGTQFRSLSTAG
jgi:hypothetical protein